MTTTEAQAPAPVEPLAPAQAALVVAFARACRAAARVTSLYPPEHPAVGSALAHVVEAAGQAAADGEFSLAVMPDDLSIGGRRLAKPDAAATELAALLHAHQVARLTLQPRSDHEEWKRFLALLSLSPEQTRLRGGLASLWAGEGQTRIIVRAIDYAAILIQRIEGERATWRAVVEQCLERDAEHPEEWMMSLILEILNHPDQAGRLVAAVDEKLPDKEGRGPVVVAGLLRAVAEFAARTQPEQVEPLLGAMATAAARLPITQLGAIAAARTPGVQPETGAFVAGLAGRMKDDALAERVTEALQQGGSNPAALAEALLALVPDVSRRSSILALARQALADPAASADAGAPEQAHVEQILARHDDEPFISDTYAAELQRAAQRALDLDEDATDGDERISAWTATIADDRLRQLDAQLLVDLMAMKQDLAEWRAVASLAVARVQVLVVVGDLSAAAFLVEALRQQHDTHPVPVVRDAAERILLDLLDGELMRHLASRLDTADPAALAGARRFCHAIGTSVVRHLAEALTHEERTRSRQNLIAILTAFGPAGRRSVERLMQSPSSAVRRTAVQLLRAFGGEEALPELNAMLGDEDPNVQREATRAIAQMTIEPAYQALTQALIDSRASTRSTITSVLWSLPAETTAGLLAYIATEAPTGSHMTPVQERVLQRLATVGGPLAVEALGRALKRGSLLTPFRTRQLRRRAAEALAAIGTPEALEVLQAASIGGTSGVRAAANAALSSSPQPPPPAAAERTP